MFNLRSEKGTPFYHITKNGTGQSLRLPLCSLTYFRQFLAFFYPTTPQVNEDDAKHLDAFFVGVAAGSFSFLMVPE